MRQFFSTLQFKLTLGYIVTLLALTIAISFVLKVQLQNQFEEHALAEVESNGNEIVAELERRKTLVNTLTQSLAAFAANSDLDPEVIRAGFPQIVDLADSAGFIAGGGFWPEPFAFNPEKERKSFFWGRNEQGQLEFFDDYNDPSGPGYHHEEWYVPARHLKDGECYWSQSYTDPYSGQPMVTCTVAVNRNGVFIGAATVDLRLEGLSQFIDALTAQTNSYAFLIDQHNRFITYPRAEQVTNIEDQSLLTTSDLGAISNDFVPLANILEAQRDKLITDTLSHNPRSARLAEWLANESYQIEPRQAQMIATSLVDPLKGLDSLILRRLLVEQDLIYQEPIAAHIFHVPDAYWKVIVVKPQEETFSEVRSLIAVALFKTLLPLMAIMLIAFFGLRRALIAPLGKITRSLKLAAEAPSTEREGLDESRPDELGQLAHWYNRRTDELSDAMSRLSIVNSELSHQANFDLLTNLTNRQQFERRLKGLIETSQWAAHTLLYIDLDQFKVVNDTCGHVAGDQLLVKVADALSRTIGSEDLIARIGGDEFAIITESASATTSAQYAEKIIATLQELRFDWEGKSFPINCSIGIVLLKDIEPSSATAMRYVDNSCYAAKDAGRNCYYLYKPEAGLIEQREGEMNWLAEIHSALEEGTFFSVYQVIWPTKGSRNRLPGLEALIRLRKPDGTVISPGAFLPAAERYNAIINIDKWMINNTLSELAKHRSVFDQLGFCSINLSASFICHNEMLSYIADRLVEHGIPANKICFEITETQIMLNMAQAKSSLRSLQQLGCKVALDDFGTGMSSYNYLQELPIDHLKIDGHFVRNITRDKVQHTFVRSFYEIAKVMELDTIAEFVEDDATFVLLRDMGVTYAQGYGVAMPLPLEEVIKILESGNLEIIGKP